MAALPEADLPDAVLPEAVLPEAALPVADFPDACLAGVDLPDPWIDLADTGFVGVSSGGASMTIGVGVTIAAGIGSDVFVTSTLASIVGISLMGEVTAAVTVEVVVAGSGNVYTGDCIGGVGCVMVTLVVLGAVCEYVRDRTTRLTCAGGKPKLYSTISSSKRFRLIERDELKLKRNKFFRGARSMSRFGSISLNCTFVASGRQSLVSMELAKMLCPHHYYSGSFRMRINLVFLFLGNKNKFCFGE